MKTNIQVEGSFKLGHVEVIGKGLPFILKFDKGYMRAFGVKSDQGEYIALIGVSNTEAEKPAIEGDYQRKEDEEITAVIGLVMQKIEDAKVLENFFKSIAETMEKEAEKEG